MPPVAFPSRESYLSSYPFSLIQWTVSCSDWEGVSFASARICKARHRASHSVLSPLSTWSRKELLFHLRQPLHLFILFVSWLSNTPSLFPFLSFEMCRVKSHVIMYQLKSSFSTKVRRPPRQVRSLLTKKIDQSCLVPYVFCKNNLCYKCKLSYRAKILQRKY